MEEKSRLRIFDRDTLKYFVTFFMFVSHLFGMGEFFLKPNGAQPMWLQIICYLGVIAPPVFFFMIAEGCRYTRSRKKYGLRLLICAFATQIPNLIFFHTENGWWYSNVVFTLFFGFMAVLAWESRYEKKIRIVLAALCCAATVLLQSDWQVFGVLFILLFYIFGDDPKKRLIAYSAVAAVHVLMFGFFMGPVIMGVLAFDMAAAYFLVTKCYNGKKGRHPVFGKWFFYIFFPAHYVVIGIVKLIAKA